MGRYYPGMPQAELDKEGERLADAVAAFAKWDRKRVSGKIHVELIGGGPKYTLRFEVLLDGKDPAGDDEAVLDRFFAEMVVNGRTGVAKPTNKVMAN